MHMNINIPKHVKVTDNGIIFYSNMYTRGIHSYIENNEVKSERIFLSSESFNVHTFLKLIIAIALMLSAFTLQKRLSLNVIAATIIFLLYGYGNFVTLCEKFFYAHMSKKKRRHHRIYVAKNMLFNTCRKLNGIPNLWEIKNKFDKELDQKIMQTLAALLLSISFLFYKYENILQLFGFLIVITFIIEILLQILKKTKLLLHLQWLFWSEPTDIEIQCVLDAFCEWLRLEDKRSSSV